MKEILTARQQHVLETLISFQREHGYPPTNKGVRWIGGLWAEHIAKGQAA
ncbi:TPA: hypothetical protein O4G90_001824 [Citrobacter amalonaticus]|nr:hypothetical protein [Citrobacter amalonaticus]